MPLKVRFLTKCHTEIRRERRIVKTKQWKLRRHRRCIERRSLFANSISLFTTRLSPNNYQESVCYTSVALCAVGTSLTLRYLRPLRVSVCPLYKPFNLSSIFRKSLLLPCYHVLHYSVTMSLITLYHVFHYSVTMSLITLSPSRNAKSQKKS